MRDEGDQAVLDTDAELEIPGDAEAEELTGTALVVEKDPELARVCVRALERLHVRAKVVWTRDEAMAVLARRAEPLSFAFVDPELGDGAGGGLAAEAHRLRPTMPLVVATNDIEDLLTADGVVLCKPFTAAQFQAALDDALVGA
jgi:ActR/RegA family two-component response regulator